MKGKERRVIEEGRRITIVGSAGPMTVNLDMMLNGEEAMSLC